MKCLICNSESRYSFTKKFIEPPYDQFMREIGDVNYYKCTNCGFVLSKTHSELDKEKWENLNYLVHHYNENPENEKMGNQPPYIDQAMMMHVLGRNGIIDIDNMLDYAAGYGSLSLILSKYLNITLPIFDHYVNKGEQHPYVPVNQLSKYKTVINSAMFEHIITRDDLEYVNNLVDTDGCLILHTVICENVPEDPNWFYFRPPVHTAFHTNKSMEVLMKQWGYKSSIYCLKARCWVLLRKKIDTYTEAIRSINQEFQTDYLYYKNGFVDYWKGF
ncbi:MAG: methyltransferase domain-containing protein [Bacteroidales bacterium]|nr:methyltransferase domain-containing protein [Bacteroidales bacterium]